MSTNEKGHIWEPGGESGPPQNTLGGNGGGHARWQGSEITRKRSVEIRSAARPKKKSERSESRPWAETIGKGEEKMKKCTCLLSGKMQPLELVAERDHTVLVKCPDGNIVVRKKRKHCVVIWD